MGYKLVASNGAVESVTDSEWQEILGLASKHGFYRPHLRLEKRYDSTEIVEADAVALYEALGQAFVDIPSRETEDDVLDRNTVQRVRRLLRSRRVRLSRTPP